VLILCKFQRIYGLELNKDLQVISESNVPSISKINKPIQTESSLEIKEVNEAAKTARNEKTKKNKKNSIF
jgi:hypothetical protein